MEQSLDTRCSAHSRWILQILSASRRSGYGKQTIVRNNDYPEAIWDFTELCYHKAKELNDLWTY